MDGPVEVLVCTQCGAPLTLGEGATTTCKRCGTETVVPERHRRLRELGSKDAALRAQGEAMFDRLDRPPSMVVGVLAMTFDLNLLAFLLVYGIPVGLASVLDVLACPRCEGRMRLLAMVTDPKSVARSLRALGEPTEAPTRTPARGPRYWQSRVLRRAALGNEAAE